MDRACALKILSLVLTLLHGLPHIEAAQHNIVAIVNSNTPQYVTPLQIAVKQLNTTFPRVSLDIIHSNENDSFSAMEQVCSKLQSGVSVVLDLSSRYVSATIRSLCEAMGVTYVSAVDPSYESQTRTYNLSLNVQPPASVMTQAVRNIVDKENLTNVGIIYDDTFDLDNKPKRLLANLPTQHLYLRMAVASSAIVDQLEKIKSAELTHLFLLSSASSAESYLGKANAQGMMSFKFRWFFLTKDPSFTCTGCKEESEIVEMMGQMNFVPLKSYVDVMRVYQTSYFNRNNVEMDSAFIYDLVQIVGQAMKKVVTSNGWTQHTYSDCFSFTATNESAYNDALLLKNEIKKKKVPTATLL